MVYKLLRACCLKKGKYVFLQVPNPQPRQEKEEKKEEE
jgi:hypothetical protein